MSRYKISEKRQAVRPVNRHAHGKHPELQPVHRISRPWATGLTLAGQSLLTPTMRSFGGINKSQHGFNFPFSPLAGQHAATGQLFFNRGIGAHAMDIYYNADTRQLIITEQGTAIAVYLQSDETPAQKAEDVIKAFHDNPKNVSICREVKAVTLGDSLPKEEGTDRLETMSKTEPTNGDGLTN